MIERKMFCDRCGKLCEKWRDNKGHSLFRIKHIAFIATWTDEKLDLCQSCFDSLNEWMKSGKEQDK